MTISVEELAALIREIEVEVLLRTEN